MTGHSTIWSVRPDPTRKDVGSDEELNHVVCCDDADLALCSTDVADQAWQEDRPADCVVCVDMGRTKSCPRHGHCPLTKRWRGWIGRERGR